jgi:hypothetical protein
VVVLEQHQAHVVFTSVPQDANPGLRQFRQEVILITIISISSILSAEAR